jgi:hypothetical protein
MRLEAQNTAHILRTLPDDSARQVFIEDPNGIKVEITGR